MDLPFRVTKVNNVKLRYVISLKFEDTSFTSLTMFGLQGKAIIYSTVKKNLPLYFRNFLVFVIVAII